MHTHVGMASSAGSDSESSDIDAEPPSWIETENRTFLSSNPARQEVLRKASARDADTCARKYAALLAICSRGRRGGGEKESGERRGVGREEEGV